MAPDAIGATQPVAAREERARPGRALSNTNEQSRLRVAVCRTADLDRVDLEAFAFQKRAGAQAVDHPMAADRQNRGRFERDGDAPVEVPCVRPLRTANQPFSPQPVWICDVGFA